jgi:hypothetical protein
MNFKEIKAWSSDQKLMRLRELGGFIREKKKQESLFDDKTELNPVLDESILIWLEIFRESYPGEKPSERMFGFLNEIKDEELTCFSLKERFFETKGLIDRYRSVDAKERLVIKPQLIARGIL